MAEKVYAKIQNYRIHPIFKKFETDEDAAKEGFLPFEKEDYPKIEPGRIPHRYMPCYVEKYNKVIRTWKAYPNEAAINKLKEKLTESDYKIIKCAEAKLTDKELPYDIVALHKERQEIRDEINRLEECK